MLTTWENVFSCFASYLTRIFLSSLSFFFFRIVKRNFLVAVIKHPHCSKKQKAVFRCTGKFRGTMIPFIGEEVSDISLLLKNSKYPKTNEKPTVDLKIIFPRCLLKNNIIYGEAFCIVKVCQKQALKR